jgi:hypothetical protein
VKLKRTVLHVFIELFSFYLAFVAVAYKSSEIIGICWLFRWQGTKRLLSENLPERKINFTMDMHFRNEVTQICCCYYDVNIQTYKNICFKYFICFNSKFWIYSILDWIYWTKVLMTKGFVHHYVPWYFLLIIL